MGSLGHVLSQHMILFVTSPVDSFFGTTSLCTVPAD